MSVVASSALLRQAGVYTASNLVSRALPFLLLPVLTRFLTPSDYGLVAMFALAATFLEPFVGLGFAGAVSVKYFDKAVDLPSYLWTGTVIVTALAVPFTVLVLVLGEPLTQLTQLPLEWLLLIVPVVAIRVFGGTFLALLRVRGQAMRYALFQNAQTLGAVLLTLLLVVGLRTDWRGRVAADIVVTIGLALAGLIWLVRGRSLRPSFDGSYARQLATFGVPLIPHAIGSVLIFQTDRLLLTNLVSVDETGLYTVGYQLALIVELVALSFNYAYAPWLFSRLAEADGETKRRLVRLTYAQFAVMAAIAGAVAVGMPWVATFLLGARFTASAQFVPWFALGFLFSGCYYMVTNYVFFAEKTRWLAGVTIGVGLVNIPLTYGLIRLNGGVGAAQAMAISLGLSFLFTWIVSQRVYPMPWLGGVERR